MEVCVQERLETGEWGHSQEEVEGVERVGEETGLEVVC